MARLEPLAPRGLDLVRRLTYAAARRLYGSPLEPAQILSRHRPLLVGYGVMSLTLDRSRGVDEQLKHLAMLRVAQMVGCEWCLDFGSRLAQDSGIPAEQLRELSRWRSSPRFDETESLVLEYAEGMTRTPVDVPEALFERVRARFDERALIELTMAISLENLHARTNWALGIEGQGFAEGMYCVRPEAELSRDAALVGDGAPR